MLSLKALLKNLFELHLVIEFLQNVVSFKNLTGIIFIINQEKRSSIFCRNTSQSLHARQFNAALMFSKVDLNRTEKSCQLSLFILNAKLNC